MGHEHWKEMLAVIHENEFFSTLITQNLVPTMDRTTKFNRCADVINVRLLQQLRDFRIGGHTLIWPCYMDKSGFLQAVRARLCQTKCFSIGTREPIIRRPKNACRISKNQQSRTMNSEIHIA